MYFCIEHFCCCCVLYTSYIGARPARHTCWIRRCRIRVRNLDWISVQFSVSIWFQCEPREEFDVNFLRIEYKLWALDRIGLNFFLWFVYTLFIRRNAVHSNLNYLFVWDWNGKIKHLNLPPNWATSHKIYATYTHHIYIHTKNKSTEIGHKCEFIGTNFSWIQNTPHDKIQTNSFEFMCECVRKRDSDE